MPIGDPPVTINELLAKAKVTADNIAKQRESAAQIAAAARQNVVPTPKEGVTK